MSKHDTHFFNIFSVVLGVLVVTALLILALARHMGYKHQFTAIQSDPMVLQGIGERTGIKVDPSAHGKVTLSFTVNEKGHSVSNHVKGFADPVPLWTLS